MSRTFKPPALTVSDDPVDKRAYVRWGFRGNAFPVRTGQRHFNIRLKDLSRGGACGLMEEPVAIGDYLRISFDERHIVEAQVMWVRRMMVGMKFSNPLTASFVVHLHERAAEEPMVEDFPFMWAIVPRISVNG